MFDIDSVIKDRGCELTLDQINYVKSEFLLWYKREKNNLDNAGSRQEVLRGVVNVLIEEAV